MTTSDWPDLVALPGVADAVEGARSAVSALHLHPANRRGWQRTAAAASVRAARASALLDGGSGEVDPDAVAVTDPVLAGALRVAAAVGSLVTVWHRAPLQALARLHTLAAADLVPTGAGAAYLGRPRADLPGIGQRLASLAVAVTASPWPGPVMTAVVHGELLALRPFGSADGVVARAAARLELIASGLDPKGLSVPEVGHLRGGDGYLGSALGFASGSPEGVAGWIVQVCSAIEAGAREGLSIADAAGSDPEPTAG